MYLSKTLLALMLLIPSFAFAEPIYLDCTWTTNALAKKIVVLDLEKKKLKLNDRDHQLIEENEDTYIFFTKLEHLEHKPSWTVVLNRVNLDMKIILKDLDIGTSAGLFKCKKTNRQI